MAENEKGQKPGCSFSLALGGLAWTLILTLFALTGNCSCLGFEKDYVEKWSECK